MATPESIAIRRAEALARVAKATRRIAKQTGAEIADFPDAHKQAEMRPLVEAEWLATSLEAIADATKAEQPETEDAPEEAQDATQASQRDDAAKSDTQTTQSRAAVVETVKAQAKAKGR